VQQDHTCLIGGAATVTDLLESPVIQKGFPQFDAYARLISSTPIRNIATIAGNFVNASPIGDLSIFFLAMDARLLLTDGHTSRQLPLREFYLGYKVLNKRPEEWIEKIIFDLPSTDERCNFEKVSKRTCLDIASVNTAIRLRVRGGRIEDAHLAAGGVGPIPAYLAKTSAALRGQRPDESLVLEAARLARTEIQPISDARGTAAYKTLLLGQLIKAHFLTLFPELRAEQLLQP
jgi:xanthine dehydrogenase small subunit